MQRTSLSNQLSSSLLLHRLLGRSTPVYMYTHIQRIRISHSLSNKEMITTDTYQDGTAVSKTPQTYLQAFCPAISCYLMADIYLQQAGLLNVMDNQIHNETFSEKLILKITL